MTMLDSRQISTIVESPIYVTSEPQETGWGQPAASRYALVVDGVRLQGQLIAGTYLSSPQFVSFDDDVAAELEAWDAASDEAFWNFESMFD